MQRGNKVLLVVVVLCTALIAAACGSDPGSLPGGGTTVGADCTTPPTLTPGALLSGCYLVGADLSQVDLTGADLRGANLSGADMTGANLTNANLTGANLTNANLTGADLTGAVLAGAILLGALFVNALLRGTDLGFGKVFGLNGNGGSNAPSGPSCAGPYCPGYNEVQTPTGPGRATCATDVGGLLGPMEPDEIFIGASEAQLLAGGSRSVVTDQFTSFKGATFDFSGDSESSGAGLLKGLNFARADFTDATFIDTYLACKVADGARFSGAHFIPGQFGRGGLFHVSMRNAEFTDAQFVNLFLCDTDFTDASMQGIDIGGATLVSCPEILPASVFNQLPDDLLVFDGADMTDATIGVLDNPSAIYPAENPGYRFTVLYSEADVHAPGSMAKHASFRGTDLDGTHFDTAWLVGSVFTGASADSVTVTTTGAAPNRFNDAVFGTGWTNTSWSGTIDFDGATCPDGGTGSPSNPCFPVQP